MYEEALKVKRAVLGEQHLDTATSLNNLAGLYHDQGRYEKAEPLYEQALAIFIKVLGKNHPDTQTVSSNYQTFLKERKEAEKKS